MGDESITKHELTAMLEVQSKTAEQMAIIASHLKAIADSQKEISKDHQNVCSVIKSELQKDICDCVTKSIDDKFKSPIDKINNTHDKVGFITTLLTVCTFVIIVSTVVVNVMNGNQKLEKQVYELQKELSAYRASPAGTAR